MGETPRVEELRRRVQSDPASLAFAPLAEEYRRLGRLDEAIALCQAGLVRYPAYVSARVTLGRTLLEAGRLPEARHELEMVLEAAPENLTAIRGLAEIHQRQGPSHQRSDTDPVAALDAAQLEALERFRSAVRAAQASNDPLR
jgi:tetratricopeptide (TPR) repeat protein